MTALALPIPLISFAFEEIFEAATLFARSEAKASSTYCALSEHLVGKMVAALRSVQNNKEPPKIDPGRYQRAHRSVGGLHEFLERGYAAFAHMKDGQAFISSIANRERQEHERLMSNT